MANEITITGKLEYADSESADLSLEVLEKAANVATKKFIHHKQNIGITEEALDLGELTSLGWAIFINRDTTNFVNIKTATSGTIFAKILAGECAMFRFGSGVTAPFAIADTAACQLEYLIIQT